MRQVSTLFVLAGFAGQMASAINRIKSLNTRGDTADAIARAYPENPDKRADYLRQVSGDLIAYVFGPAPIAGFCRDVDQPCRVDADKGSTRTCNRHGVPAACFRERPKMIAIVAHPRVHQDMIDKFGRATLVFKYDASDLDDLDKLERCINTAKIAIGAARDYLYTRPQNELAPLLPLLNFQHKTGQHVAAAAQADPTDLPAVMKRFHRALYDPKFVNQRRPYMRGGYRLNNTVAFQRDLLHDSAQTGGLSRADIFHLINAHHHFGAHTQIGMHFDVSADRGRALNEIFEDILTGKPTSAKSTHVNITPCDRIV